MNRRIAQSGYGFVIAAAPATDGHTLMVASQCVRDIEILQEEPRYDVVAFGGQSVRNLPAPPEMKITASLGAVSEPHHQMVHLNVERGGYAEAWRRLFDIWVPPQFTDETRSQILTHYTFGDLR